jgi:hypothetical protein
MLFLIAIGLILAWKVAGMVGADYFLLTCISTPESGAKSKKKCSSSQPFPDLCNTIEYLTRAIHDELPFCCYSSL